MDLNYLLTDDGRKGTLYPMILLMATGSPPANSPVEGKVVVLPHYFLGFWNIPSGAFWDPGSACMSPTGMTFSENSSSIGQVEKARPKMKVTVRQFLIQTNTLLKSQGPKKSTVEPRKKKILLTIILVG